MLLKQHQVLMSICDECTRVSNFYEDYCKDKKVNPKINENEGDVLILEQAMVMTWHQQKQSKNKTSMLNHLFKAVLILEKRDYILDRERQST